jgi:hypothetical protein
VTEVGEVEVLVEDGLAGRTEGAVQVEDAVLEGDFVLGGPDHPLLALAADVLYLDGQVQTAELEIGAILGYVSILLILILVIIACCIDRKRKK